MTYLTNAKAFLAGYIEAAKSTALRPFIVVLALMGAFMLAVLIWHFRTGG